MLVRIPTLAVWQVVPRDALTSGESDGSAELLGLVSPDGESEWLGSQPSEAAASDVRILSGDDGDIPRAAAVG